MHNSSSNSTSASATPSPPSPNSPHTNNYWKPGTFTILGYPPATVIAEKLSTAIEPRRPQCCAATAKTCRAVVSGAMKLAVRYGAITANPAREVDSIEAKPKNPPRALTGHEVSLACKSLAADERAVEADLPDLVTFILGTNSTTKHDLPAQVSDATGQVECDKLACSTSSAKPPPPHSAKPATPPAE